MRKNVLVLLGIVMLGMASCMVVVEDDEPCAKKNDGDTVTVIISKVPAGTTSLNPMGR
jgi:hypothetical protein